MFTSIEHFDKSWSQEMKFTQGVMDTLTDASLGQAVVDDHRTLPEQGQRFAVDFTVFDQLHFAGDVHRDGRIQALGDFFVVESCADLFDHEKPATDQCDNQQQRGRQP